MSDKSNADQRIAQALEKIKSTLEKKVKLESETKEVNIVNPAIEKCASFTGIEEILIISPETTLIKDRQFINLNWVNKDYQQLTFKNCMISNSNFSSSNLDGLRLENCKIYNCNFEKASIQEGFFEDCVFFDKDSLNGCNFNSADLRRSEFHRCNLSMNHFKRANAFQIIINECRAQGCTFQFANFVKIFEWQQEIFIENLGIIVFPNSN